MVSDEEKNMQTLEKTARQHFPQPTPVTLRSPGSELSTPEKQRGFKEPLGFEDGRFDNWVFNSDSSQLTELGFDPHYISVWSVCFANGEYPQVDLHGRPLEKAFTSMSEVANYLLTHCNRAKVFENFYQVDLAVLTKDMTPSFKKWLLFYEHVHTEAPSLESSFWRYLYQLSPQMGLSLQKHVEMLDKMVAVDAEDD